MGTFTSLTFGAADFLGLGDGGMNGLAGFLAIPSRRMRPITVLRLTPSASAICPPVFPAFHIYASISILSGVQLLIIVSIHGLFRRNRHKASCRAPPAISASALELLAGQPGSG